jgi:RNA polymerase sigma-70 factor, ECF subfamily
VRTSWAAVNSEAFFRGFPGPRVAWTIDDLDGLLGQALEQARAPWPDLHLPDDEFLAYLGARIEPGPEAPAAALARLHLPDLYLACGCARGLPEAVTAFVAHHLRDLSRYLARLSPNPSLVEEVHQELCQRLLVAAPPEAPRIVTYTGRGPLSAWVAVAAQRTALNLLGRGAGSRTRPLGDALERRLAESADPELLLARAHLREGLQAAIRHALATLTTRDRTLLRLSVMGGVGCRKLAEMYGVNFATVSRWLVRSRASLLAGVEEFLKKERGIDPDDLTSLLGAARSQIDLSLSGLLVRDD